VPEDVRLIRPASLVVATAALLSPGLFLGPAQDASVFLLAGVRIREGFMPYRDLFDDKPPGSYLLNALGQIALPWLDPWLVTWLLSLAFSGASVLVVDAILRRSIGSGAAWVWSLVCCAGVAGYLTASGGGLTETYALLPLVLALWMVVSKPAGLRMGVAVGVLLVAACLCSLECAPPAAVIACAFAYERRNLRAMGMRAVALGGAAVSLAALVLLWLVIGGAAASAFDQIVAFNEAYAATFDAPLVGFLLAAVLLGGLGIPVVLAAARMVSSPGASDRLGWLSLAWVVFYLAFLGSENRVFPHYLVLAVPPLVILAARGTEPLWAALRAGCASPRQGVLAGVAVSTFLLLAACSVALGQMAVSDQIRFKQSSDPVAAFIRARVPTDRTLFVWGYDPVLYLTAGLEPYDRYIYLFPLIAPGYGSEDRTAALLAEWEKSPPDVIVESYSSVPLNRSPDIGSDAHGLDTLAPLRTFVNARYRLVASFATEDVYLLDGP
jgi:hypothetical protein